MRNAAGFVGAPSAGFDGATGLNNLLQLTRRRRPALTLHGEIKLPGMANHFYRERVDQHLRIVKSHTHRAGQNGLAQATAGLRSASHLRRCCTATRNKGDENGNFFKVFTETIG